MIIVQINETCGTGSIGRTTGELAVALEDAGHESIVFFAKGNPTFHHAIRIGNTLDHKVHALFSRITGLQGYYSHISTWKMLRKLDKISPDVIQLCNLHANYINLGMLLKYLAKKNIPTVITLHDCWLYTGKCFYYVSAGCQKWKNDCGHCPLIKTGSVNKTYVFDTTKKSIQDKRKWMSSIPRLQTIGVSKWVTDEAKESILAKTNPVTIYNWIDLDTFQPRETNLREEMSLSECFVILFVASFINRVKGYDIIKGLSEQLNPNWRIIVIGKETEELPENVIHISHTDNAIKLAEYYSMADVCVNATLYETFGKVTAEAICCGTPIIVYNNTASPELVDEGCGIVVDQELGLKGIIKALTEIETRGKSFYRMNCLKSAKKRFSQETGIQQYIRLYEEISQSR